MGLITAWPDGPADFRVCCGPRCLSVASGVCYATRLFARSHPHHGRGLRLPQSSQLSVEPPARIPGPGEP
ncbi:hypothetical protein B0H12DRAFT_1133052 [Mycena haematopus]|nr:hypothetical protein B0H12DRAFT_1133052 [Mycena haematopus]